MHSAIIAIDRLLGVNTLFYSFHIYDSFGSTSIFSCIPHMVLIIWFLYDTLSKQQVGTKMKKPQVPYLLGIITSVIEAAAKTATELLLFEITSLTKKEGLRNHHHHCYLYL
jgi:hypothetical protein